MLDVRSRQAPAAFLTVYGHMRTLSTQHPTTIGRGAENDIVLQEPECSRRHSEIEMVDGRWCIRDLGSRNGTYVEGDRIEGIQPLKSGQSIRIALVKMKFTTASLTDTVSSMPTMDDDMEASGSDSSAVISEVDDGALVDLPGWDAEEDSAPLIGESEAVRTLRDRIPQVARLEAPILIEGEAGVGKGMIAYAIHRAMGKGRSAMLLWDCAQLSSPGNASESGIWKSFRIPGGDATLYLDDISSLSNADQGRILGLLNQLEHRTEARPTDRVRVISSTSMDLEQAVAAGSFRSDLFYRLCVIKLPIEPLRRRPEDILPIAEHYRARFSKRLGREVEGFTQAALRAMESHKWPGNLRELRNTIYRAVALCRTPMMDVSDLYLSVTATGDHSTIVSPSYQAKSLEDVELAHILATLNQTDWNKTRASQILRIERSTLDRKLKRFGLQRPRPTQGG